MAKESYRSSVGLRKDNLERLEIVNDIIEDYADQGYKLTLRQLYYQLVSRDIVPNQQAEYAKLGNILVKGRMAGVVDWEAIEDRIRVPHLPYWVTGIEGALEDTIGQYRLDRQKGQKNYIEVWVEKDALSGVLKTITEYYHIVLMVNRGYSSCSAMHDAFERLERQECNGIYTNILYLGDHDPSGMDMVRDVQDRLIEFGVCPSIKHTAITLQQIDKYSPPPNPAKITDPRAQWYMEKYGETSWEVDALEPKILHELLKTDIEGLIDMELFAAQLEQEEENKKDLRDLIDEL